MTMPPRLVRVRCPRCKTVYEDSYYPSLNLTLEPWLTQEEIEDCCSVTCPNCGRRIWLASIVVCKDGSWAMTGSIRRKSWRSRFRVKRVKVEFIDNIYRG